MKQHNQNENANNVRTNAHASQSGGHKPENKDDLDSRQHEEQTITGEDITHNEKDKKSEHKRKQ